MGFSRQEKSHPKYSRHINHVKRTLTAAETLIKQRSLFSTARVPESSAAAMDRILPRILAASRSFRRAMSTTTVAGSIRLPQPEVLPHSVAGIFSNYCDHGVPYLFARPRGRGPKIDGTFSSMPDGARSWDTILDHCNGLILYENMSLYVCNPATRRWALLPPPHNVTRYNGSYLVFDPALSLDYKVFMIPEVPGNEDEGQVEALDSMEWPPLHHKLQVYSSRTQRWVETTLFREGEPCGTVAEARLDPFEPVFWGPERRYAEYWKGALYVHCRGAYVMRFGYICDNLHPFCYSVIFPNAQ